MTPKVLWLAKEIVAKYVSYHFTDWHTCVDEVVDTLSESQGTTYTQREIDKASDAAWEVAEQMEEAWKAKFPTP